MRVDPKEPHATLGPKVPTDAWANARLEQPHNEIAAKGLAFKPKQCQVRFHRFFPRELVAERLFSQVGIHFSAKRKRGSAKTLEDLAFAQANLP